VRTWIGIGAAFAVASLLGALHYADADAVLQFAVGIVALALLAWTVGVGTETVGARFGPATTGVLQSTLGNLPELFIVIFALRAGEIVVAQTSILGSLLANALLILGLTIVAGSWRSPDGIMRFHPRLPNDTTMLLMLVVFLIAIISTSIATHDEASKHAVTISAIGAVFILLVYGAWLANYLRAGADQEPAMGEGHAPAMGFGLGLAVLALAGVAAAFTSEWFVSVIDPAVEELGISKAFTGLVIVAIAGNAVENVVGIQLAWKRRFDLAVSVVKNSVAQIAAFLYPALVLLSLPFAQRLTFGVPEGVGLVLVVALVFAALAIWQITGDGEAPGYEGLALLATYAVLATVVWFE
jgi:Ca2+:H+ antiporter